VCRDLVPTGAEWQCDPVGDTIEPGRVSFYTRVASSYDTVIEHRWYQGDRLRQRIPLRIKANPNGYRTYSRSTVETSGNWKVEVWTEDGTLLTEERFTVR
jgi:hypothetical protein